ncbi:MULTISPECIES: SDH family Clp fold serine proteinase [Burkholderia cepacia complex]|uniref:SDH family Clp fold serine proteinase n=1 Tax=Burkholderia cepacia complex TaxID=87882 RepID=UPI00158EE737|nr:MULTISPECIES: hypothetical protein [Burkholderia cepacia complex]MBJ9924097.1 hypothetical protein [Burkholderia cenocepacia]MCW3538945.1 hypothetical protein [Burkholderia cenocepacia]MDN7484590.1 hypothetical protein [Burkholderia orbicola]MDN7733246.1 hypothetical protein [Burkholderia orbicola]UJH72577.1 hypothetical protein L0U95_12290 [Burkholderia cenocepacia]
MPNDQQSAPKPAQFPRGVAIPSQSPKYWVKEKDRYIRQLLIDDIQERTGRPLVVYFAQLDQPINHTDPDDIAEILSGVGGDAEVDLFIQTPGGNVDATEKLIGVLRQRLKSWRVIVPSWAKSAGTVIALSGEKILLGVNSELGPIDPQFQGPNGMSIPCEILSTDPTQPYHVQQLAGLAVSRMRQLALSLLEKGMMHGKAVDEIQAVLGKISSTNGYKSHGAVIDFDEAKALGLAVEFLPPDGDLWKQLWLLYCMYDYDTKAKNVGRLVEGTKFSIARSRA